MMPKKRGLSDNFEGEGNDDSSVEEDVQTDVKNVFEDDNEGIQEEEGMPFLDTFYGLSSSSATERAQAAHALLEHCLFGPNANFKDAAYALTRLLNGLCSGRASSRQGYASALTSFLKIAFQKEIIDDIQREYSGENEEQSAPVVFIRNNLLATTDPSKTQTGKFGKKKGSEERDYCFGRVFGILSVIRSGILSMNVSEDDSALEEVAVGYANDLVDLYQRKKWMREPATQGILTLLGCFSRSDNEATMSVANEVVKHVLIPKLLLVESEEDQERSALLSQYSPEQIAIAVQIQANSDSGALPFPLDEAILSTENLKYLSDALASTSHVVHPRTHLVWDVLWSSLTTDAAPAKGTSRKNSQARELRPHAPASSESARDVVAELFRTVVIKSLLGIGEEGKSSSTTHERRALALTLVKVLCGGEYSSSTMGTATMALDLDLLENDTLCPSVVQRLFLDVISAGGKTKSQQQQRHMLKPLALHVLDSIVPAIDDEQSWEKRLAFARAILSCDPRFDGRTKTRTVSSLLFPDEAVAVGETNADSPLCKIWKEYVEFLKRHILSFESASDGGAETGEEAGKRSMSYDATGYVDLLYSAIKNILRMQSDEDNSSFEDFKRTIAQDILGFLMAAAFFDCSKLTAANATEQITSSSKKKKKKKKKATKQKSDSESMHSAVKGGLLVQKIVVSDCDEKEKPLALIPYAVRVSLSSRFYSLLADFISAVVPRRTTKAETMNSGSGTSETRSDKDARILEILADVCHGWFCLEDAGAHPFSSAAGGDEVDKEEAEKTRNLVCEFQAQAVTRAKSSPSFQDKENAKDLSKVKTIVGSTQLMSILYLHLLHCGTPESIADAEDDPTFGDEDEEDDSEVMELISDLSDITKSLLGETKNEDEEGNALTGLAELCVGILSSPLCSGSQTRGASSKIVRESVKSAWSGALSAAVVGSSSATEASGLLGDEVVGVLLNAVGASDGSTEAENDLDESDVDMDVDGGSEDEENSEGGDSDNVVFSASAAKALDIDSDDERDMDIAPGEEGEDDGEESEEEDVELDPTQLQSLLLEDSDADMSAGSDGELEHHAGADAALAQLIKLKQDARKTGKQARDRLETSTRLRCVVLIETLVSALNSMSAGSASGSVVRSEIMLQTLIPLIRERRSLEKSISTSSELGKKGAVSEKRALLDRLTTLLKSKICKMRLASFAADDLEGIASYTSDLASQILIEARKSNELGHGSCCSAALIMTLRSLPKPDDMVAAAAMYKEAVNEWSSKRTTRLNTSLFEDLIQQGPSLAQVVLTEPLATATVEARSPFLKSEAFRLLASDYAIAKASAAEEGSLESMGTEALKKVAPLAAKNASEALQNSDMQKTKRVRDVLKAVDKVVSFATATSFTSEAFRVQLRDLLQGLDALKEGTESHGVKNACEKVSNEITTYLDSVKSSDIMHAEKEAAETKTMPKESKVSSSKKKKKKKGKKK